MPRWGVRRHIHPAEQANAFGYFAAMNMVMNKYNSTFPVTFVDITGLQW